LTTDGQGKPNFPRASEGALVFINYAREDEEYAMKLYKDLKNAGINPWIDKECIRPGEYWKAEIGKALRKSRYCIAVLSSHSVGKIGYVQRELKDALEKQEEVPESDIYLIPARIDNCDISDLKLGQIQYADLFTDWNGGIEKILRAINPEQRTAETEGNVYKIKEKLENSLVNIETELSPPKLAKRRLEEQISWHSQKARHNKLRFRRYQFIILILGTIIPIINIIIFDDLPTRIATSIIGVIIVISASVSQLENYQENWILYRIKAELLKKEKYFFENNVDEYSHLTEKEQLKFLIERVQSIVSP
jgi:TIR domain/Protein of unknown function (DUF4231)